MCKTTCSSRQRSCVPPRPFTTTPVPVPRSCRTTFGCGRPHTFPPLRASAAASGADAHPAWRPSADAAVGPSLAPARAHQPQQPRSSPAHSRRSVVAAVSLGDLQLDMPEIDGDIRSLQVEMGAIFDDAGLATTFGRKRQALQALETGLVLVDQSHWGRLRVSAEDRLALLHNQSTADFKRLQPGQAVDTVFVTATGRCLDLGTALVLPSSVLLMVDSREGKDALAARLDKVIFRGDNVTVQDISDRTAQIALLGPEAEVVLRELAPGALAGVLDGPTGRHALVGFRGKPVFVASVSGLGPSVRGFTLVADESVAGDLYAAFAAKGAIPMGTDDWEAARILAGRPTRRSELTDAYNPLEAGLYGAVSLNKGCYIGQETLAKLHLRDGVNKQLWGLQLSGPTAPGAEITSEMSKVGVVTSVCQDGEGEWVGLGYLRSRLQGAQIELEGVRVAVAGAPATVVSIPFATRTFSAEAEAPAARAVGSAPDGDAISARVDEAKKKKAEAQAEKQAVTEAKLKAMQERVAAWQAAQQQQQEQQQQQ